MARMTCRKEAEIGLHLTPREAIFLKNLLLDSTPSEGNAFYKVHIEICDALIEGLREAE